MRTYAGRGIHGETVATIGRRIVCGHYEPGELLFIEDLGKELQVSRTAIREALKVLAAKGMVESRAKRGTLIRQRTEWNLLDPDVIAWGHGGSPSLQFMQDLSEVRFIVEPAAARMAALRRDEADLERLRQALQEMVHAGEAADRAIKADLSFHRALLLATHNEMLAQMEIVIEAALRVRDQVVHQGAPWSDPMPEHLAVFDAVVAGDGELAAEEMRRLLERAWREAAELVKLGSAPAAPPRLRRRARPQGVSG